MFVLKSSGYATSYYKRFQSTEVDSVKMSNYGQWKTDLELAQFVTDSTNA